MTSFIKQVWKKGFLGLPSCWRGDDASPLPNIGLCMRLLQATGLPPPLPFGGPSDHRSVRERFSSHDLTQSRNLASTHGSRRCVRPPVRPSSTVFVVQPLRSKRVRLHLSQSTRCPSLGRALPDVCMFCWRLDEGGGRLVRAGRRYLRRDGSRDGNNGGHRGGGRGQGRAGPFAAGLFHPVKSPEQYGTCYFRGRLPPKNKSDPDFGVNLNKLYNFRIASDLTPTSMRDRLGVSSSLRFSAKIWSPTDVFHTKHPQASSSKKAAPGASEDEVESLLLQQADESLRKAQEEIERNIGGKI